jgi:hypothetical protein
MEDLMPQQHILIAEGFEEAFVGVATDFAGHRRAVYDYGKCVRVLMRRDKMSREDAVEYMDFNVVGAYVGEATPIWIERMKFDSLIDDCA